MVGSRIVATGCTSGLGFKALYQIIKTAPSTLPPPYHIYLLARDANAAHSLRAKGELEALAQAHGGDVQSSVELRQANLSSLKSVREAALAIKSEVAASSNAATKQISPGRIDVFLLNAGIAATSKRLVDGDSPTRDGDDVLQDSSGHYEETSCVNHISQLLLLSLLLPDQLRNTTQRDHPVRVVFTGSALHRRLRSVDDLQAFFDASSSETAWDMMRSYGASKFLQMLGVQHLVRMLQERHRRSGEGQVEVVVVQPGFVPNTGLSRESSLFGRIFMQHVLPRLPFSFITTPEQGAGYIAEACYRPLEGFPIPDVKKEEEDVKVSSWLEGGAPVHDGVRKALVVKGGQREAPDERTEDAELARKWWPAVVEREWQAATGSAS